MKETLAAHGLRSEVPYEGAARNYDLQASSTLYSASQSSQRQQKPPARGKNALVNGMRTCYDYNNGKCSRKAINGGCENPKGEKFAHNCNVFLKDKNATGSILGKITNSLGSSAISTLVPAVSKETVNGPWGNNILVIQVLNNLSECFLCLARRI